MALRGIGGRVLQSAERSQTGGQDADQTRWAVIAPMFFASTVGMVSYPASPGCASQRATQWVVENHDQLPKTLEELRVFSTAYRGAILQHLDVKTRAFIWQEHMDAMLEGGSRLTDTQRRFLRMVKDSTPAWYDLDEAQLRAKEASIDAEGQAILGDSLFSVYVHIAPPASQVSSGYAESGLTGAIDGMLRAVISQVSSKFLPTCNCTFFGAATGCTPIVQKCESSWPLDCNDNSSCDGHGNYCDGLCRAAE